jgi:hypothetical protein
MQRADFIFASIAEKAGRGWVVVNSDPTLERIASGNGSLTVQQGRRRFASVLEAMIDRLTKKKTQQRLTAYINVSQYRNSAPSAPWLMGRTTRSQWPGQRRGQDLGLSAN